MLESCREYLRLVVGKNRWSKGVGDPLTSDLVQDAILDAWRGFGRFEGRTHGQLRAWLRAILIHSLIKARRRPVPARLDCGDGGEPIPDCITPPSLVVQREESNEVIDTAMRALPEHYRAAIRWRLWEDLSFAEIGARLEIRTIAPRSSMGVRSPGCGNCWGPAMNPDDPTSVQSVEDAQARVLACDALLHLDATEAVPTLPEVASLRGRGHDRLRLLLRLLEASEGDADCEPVGDRASPGEGQGEDRPFLGRFEVLEHLGAGGFGFVVRARDRLLGREVALKMPLPERMLGSGDVDRFLRRLGAPHGSTIPTSCGSSTRARSARSATSSPRSIATDRTSGTG